jgi:hypothetical protein
MWRVVEQREGGTIVAEGEYEGKTVRITINQGGLCDHLAFRAVRNGVRASAVYGLVTARVMPTGPATRAG